MKNKILIGIPILIAVVVLAGYFYSLGNLPQPQETYPATGVVKEFTMTAQRFDFSPASIEVEAGDTVILYITGLDDGKGGGHGFAISEFRIDEEIGRGRTATIQFVADRKGTFTYYCSVQCGDGHYNMRGTLTVS